MRNAFDAARTSRFGAITADVTPHAHFDIESAMDASFHESRRSRAVTIEKYCLVASALLVVCAVMLAIVGS